MTPNKLRSDPPYQHPLFQPDKRHLPPPPPPTAAQSTPVEVPTTFDEILPIQTSTGAQRSRSSCPTNNASLASSTAQPSMQPDAPDEPRKTCFFARFRPSQTSRPPQPECDLPRSLDRKARRELRQASRERAKQCKAERKEAQKQERSRNQWLGGMAWGFDPNAGQSPRRSDEVRVSCSSGGESRSSHRGSSTDRSIERGTRRSYRSAEMGLESGGPGNEGKFDYGVLKSARR